MILCEAVVCDCNTIGMVTTMRNNLAKLRSRYSATSSFDVRLTSDSTSEYKSICGRVFHRLGQEYFLAGAGTVFNLAGRHAAMPLPSSLAKDAEKIRDDFLVIGNDFRNILNTEFESIS